MKTLISSNGCCYSDTAKLRRFQKNVSILFIFFNALFSGVALAFTEGQHVTTLLEGCRNNGSITLPINGQFVCPDSAYTNGNLGKSWNELDLVPHRLTTRLENQRDATTNYNLVVTGDGIINSKVGWDVVSVPVVNTAKSDASCSISAGEQLKLGTQDNPFGGGTDTVIYRELSIHQNKNTTCVFDYYQRLSLGAHLYPGSSLQSYLATTQDLSGSKKTLSIPTNEIKPQELYKDMSATQNSETKWNLTKQGPTEKASFGDVCAVTDVPKPIEVSFKVEWTLTGTEYGDVTAEANIYVTNPASRVITVGVTDKVYKGSTTDVELNSFDFPPVDVSAGAVKQLIGTHTAVIPADQAGKIGDWLNDVATAIYIDKVTGIEVPGQTTATASTQIKLGTAINTSVNISDTESISGLGLSFSVAQPTIGEFIDYIADTKTINPVNWKLVDQTSSGSVDFVKTIYLDEKRVTTGSLSDTATLQTTTTSMNAGPVVADIESSALVNLSFSKTIPNVLDANEKIEVFFHITRANDPTYSKDETFTFVGGSDTTQSINLTGLVPDNYVVTETGSKFYPAGCNDLACSSENPLVSDVPSKNADLSLKEGGIVANCSASLAFENRLRQDKLATVNVKKLTAPTLVVNDPDYNWTFTLGNNTATTGANADPVFFGGNDTPLKLAEGSYTMMETTKTGWDLTNVTKPDGTNTTANACTFVVDYPEDYDKVFTCTFNNTKRGEVKVTKTVSDSIINNLQHAFTFQVRQDASSTTEGSVLETQVADVTNGGNLEFATLLIPDSVYQLCEVVMPGWSTNLNNSPDVLFVPNSIIPPTLPNPGVNNMTVCVDFKVGAGETKSFAVDNAPPPGGRGLTIGFWKNWASCANSKGGQKPVLDQTMAKATPLGIKVGNFYLIGDPSNENLAPDCSKAVSLLNKSTFKGKKMASDPLFNMTAQLVAAELNVSAGAYTCSNVVTSIEKANNDLLIKYNFTGNGYTGKLSASDATTANNLATFLDNYNNNRTGVCQ